MGNKDSQNGTPRTTAQVATPKEEWSDKTSTSWREHTGFLQQTSKVNIAPPPCLDPRTVPRPGAVVTGAELSQSKKRAIMLFVLLICTLGGLYSNGMLDPLLEQYAPQLALAQPPAPAALANTAAATAAAAAPTATNEAAQPSGRVPANSAQPNVPPAPAATAPAPAPATAPASAAAQPAGAAAPAPATAQQTR